MNDYPEAARRQDMLRSVHDWYQSQTDYNPMLKPQEIEQIGDGLGLNGPRSINLFKRLVAEGFIHARLAGRVKSHGPGFMFAPIEGLTGRGLVAIGEAPDLTERLVRGLRAAIERIEQDPTIPDDEKRRNIDWLNHGISVLGSLEASDAKQILDGMMLGS